MGLHLACNAGNVLFTENTARIGAAAQVTGLPPGYAADVIAIVGVSYRAGIAAVQDNTLGKAYYTTGVGNNILVFSAQKRKSQAV